MTPSARLQAIIDLLTEIDEMPRPADAVMSAFFRVRRFIGAKDRTAIAEGAYRILRHHARLLWWLERENCAPSPRGRVIADLMLSQGRTVESIEESFSGGKFAPAALSPSKKRLARALSGHTLEHPAMPETVRVECPEWAEAGLRATLGNRFATEMSALLEAAPLDLRVNAVKATREQAQAALAKSDVIAEPTRLSPLGLRVRGRPPLATLPVFKDGWVEIQDEGSQLVALIADPQPGMQVVDFCAGAGGKTLALAAQMNNKGRVIACDVLDKRLKRATERFRRAGLHNIETRALSSERDPWVKRHKGRFDRVLVDAPCSGTGTWRRNPDARWRMLGPDLAELTRLQREILDSAARLVKPGGRLIYATCSLLHEENEAQVEHFLGSHSDFSVVPLAEAWQAIGNVPPAGETPYLRLSPAQHDTDGFFAAVLKRRETSIAEEMND